MVGQSEASCPPVDPVEEAPVTDPNPFNPY